MVSEDITKSTYLFILKNLKYIYKYIKIFLFKTIYGLKNFHSKQSNQDGNAELLD